MPVTSNDTVLGTALKHLPWFLQVRFLSEWMRRGKTLSEGRPKRAAKFVLPAGKPLYKNRERVHSLELFAPLFGSSQKVEKIIEAE